MYIFIEARDVIVVHGERNKGWCRNLQISTNMVQYLGPVKQGSEPKPTCIVLKLFLNCFGLHIASGSLILESEISVS